MHANVMESSSQRQQSIHQGVPDHTVSFLDSAVPLKDASHGDVVRYSVETIWRKAECIATLIDGTKTKLRDAWQFIGYTGNDPARFLLFRSNEAHIEVAARANDINLTPDRARIYTSVDGSQVSLAG